METRQWLNYPAALVAGLFIFGAHADDVTESFDEIDSNGDGYISRDEAQAMPSLADVDHWAKYDKDDDGQIDAVEFSAFEAKHMEKETQEPQPTE
ncbi:MAG: hypothetical protein PVF85_10340 [Anaerolineales bacterium]|jgi:hypothetical protein